MTPRTITFRERTGWMTHIGAFVIVTPSIEHVRAAVGLDELGPQVVAGAVDALGDRHPGLGLGEEPVAVGLLALRVVVLLPRPPVLGVRLAVQRALAGDRDVVLLVGVDERREPHELDAFPARPHDRQVGRGVAAEPDRGALGDVQVDPRLQVDGAGEEDAGRHDDAPAARRGRRPRSRRGRRRVASVVPSATAPKSVTGKSRSGNVGARMPARMPGRRSHGSGRGGRSLGARGGRAP